MAIQTGIGRMFFAECAIKLHDLETDVLKVALYGPNANITPNSLVYTTSGEVSGGGYSAGGEAVPMAVIGPSGSGIGDTVTFPTFEHGYASPEADTVITAAGVAIRGCMLYNSTQQNRNILTLDFGRIVTPVNSLRFNWGPTGLTRIENALIPFIGNLIS